VFLFFSLGGILVKKADMKLRRLVFKDRMWLLDLILKAASREIGALGCFLEKGSDLHSHE
jgi:hypothetical protein